LVSNLIFSTPTEGQNFFKNERFNIFSSKTFRLQAFGGHISFIKLSI